MQTRERAHCAHSVFPFIKKRSFSIPDLKVAATGMMGGGVGGNVVSLLGPADHLYIQ